MTSTKRTLSWRRMKGVLLAVLGMAGASPVVSCASAQSAAERDPMRCERNPDCARYRGGYIDCSRQCADNSECVDRCRQVQADPGLGH